MKSIPVIFDSSVRLSMMADHGSIFKILHQSYPGLDNVLQEQKELKNLLQISFSKLFKDGYWVHDRLYPSFSLRVDIVEERLADKLIDACLTFLDENCKQYCIGLCINAIEGSAHKGTGYIYVTRKAILVNKQLYKKCIKYILSIRDGFFYRDETITLKYQVEENAILKSSLNVKEEILSSTWSRDGSTVVIGTKSRLLLFNPASNHVETIDKSDTLTLVQICARCMYIAYISLSPDANEVVVRQVSSARNRCTFKLSKPVDNLIWDKDGSRILIIGPSSMSAFHIDVGLLWEVNQGNQYYQDWTRDGKFIATSDASMNINIWDSSNGKLVRTIPTESQKITGVSWNSSASLISITMLDKGLAIVAPFLSIKMEYIKVSCKYGRATWNSSDTLFGFSHYGTRIIEYASLRIVGLLPGWFPQWSPVGNLIATIEAAKVLKVWELTETNPDNLDKAVWNDHGLPLISVRDRQGTVTSE